ncbi:MAG TPA: hypothetical protein VGY54_05485 [Polyangiaceae bacterium]|jgi:hypothetical protein|nr:hypothetical protein [Polyangiaceae bacterium]
MAARAAQAKPYQTSVLQAPAQTALSQPTQTQTAQRKPAQSVATPPEPAPPEAAPTPAPPAKPPGNVVKMRIPARTRWTAMLLAAAMALLVAALFVPLGVVAVGRPDPQQTNAAELRRKAFEACNAKRWKECADRLDEARAIDPEGEHLPEVQDERRQLLELERPR